MPAVKAGRGGPSERASGAGSARGTIAARVVVRVLDLCRARGHDPEAVCLGAGISSALLAEPDARISYEAAERLGRRALEVTGDDNFGLHLAERVRDTGSLDAGVLLLMASPSIGVALERMALHQRYWGDGDRATLRRVPGGLAVRYALAGAEGAYARHADECAMAEIALGVRILSGEELHARVVRFRHAAPRATGEHQAIFACPLEFRAAHTEIVFDDAVLDTPPRHANEAFAAIFEQQVQRALARLPALPSASAEVRATLRAALGTGAFALGGTARALGTSQRTLQRRLREEGTSFAAIVDALRREMALAYLDRRIPIPEIAELLGYADTTAFHHAFRRWTGSSPARYLG
jgi:AraC-like DNA-binding protein